MERAETGHFADDTTVRPIRCARRRGGHGGWGLDRGQHRPYGRVM